MTTTQTTTNCSLISQATELASLDEAIKEMTAKAELIKTSLKAALPNGTHVLGNAVITIKDGSNSHINKEALCQFFNVTKEALVPFTSVSTYRTLSAKKANLV